MMQFGDLWLNLSEVAAVYPSNDRWFVVLKSGYEMTIRENGKSIEELRNYLDSMARQNYLESKGG